MKLLALLSTISMFITLGLNAQVSFELTHKYEDSHYLINGIEAKNQCIYLVGRKGNHYNRFDGLIMKIEPGGDTTTRYIKQPNASIKLGGVYETESNSFLAFGGKCDTLDNINYISIIRFNENLDIIYTKNYIIPSEYDGFGYTSSIEKDSLIYVGGEYYTYPSYHKTACILTTNQNADSLDAFIFDEYPTAQKTSDLVFNQDSTELWMIGNNFDIYAGGEKISLDLDLNINELTRIPEIDDCIRAKWANEQQLMIGGRYIGDRATNNDHYLMRVDTGINVLETLHIGSPDTIEFAAWDKCMDFTDPNHIYIGGTSDEEIAMGPSMPNLIMVSKTDVQLNLKRRLLYGNGDWYYHIMSVIATSDGGVLLCGYTFDYESAPNHRDLYVLKLDGDYFVDIPTTPANQPVAVIPWPNPGTDRLNIKSRINRGEICFYNSNGSEVYSAPIIRGDQTINTQNWSAGTYYYQVIKNQKSIDHGKWIKTL